MANSTLGAPGQGLSQLSAEQLKQELHSLRQANPDYDESLAIRMHRAISWLACAEQQAQLKPANPDMQYIGLWVALNACYTSDTDRQISLSERQAFNEFVKKLVQHDEQKRIYHALWHTYSGPVKALVKNQYVFAPFWEQARQPKQPKDSAENWEAKFKRSSSAAINALSRQNVPVLLSIVLDRLYVLRNQLVHGGATWQSSVNRAQVKDGINMLTTLMPVIIDIMLNNPNEDWGEIVYPVVE